MFLCVTDESFGTRIPVAYLEAIQKKWRTNYGDRGATAMEYGMQSEFSRIMKQQMVFDECLVDRRITTQMISMLIRSDKFNMVFQR